jgi:hypothetical protein
VALAIPVTKPFTNWTTIKLMIDVNGSCTQALAGASPFPRGSVSTQGRRTPRVALVRVDERERS